MQGCHKPTNCKTSISAKPSEVRYGSSPNRDRLTKFSSGLFLYSRTEGEQWERG